MMEQLSLALFFCAFLHSGNRVHSFSTSRSLLPTRSVALPSSTLSRRPMVTTSQTQQQISSLFSMPDDPYPSDYDVDDLEPTQKKVSVDVNEEDATIRDEIKRELILLASVTNRGTCARDEEKNLVIDLVTQLEALNPTADPALNSQGDWELCYSSTQSFRSSPFFQTIRTILGEDNKATADTAFTIHDRATTASRVGKVRQIIDKDNKELVSEYDLSVGLLPGLPVRVKGCVVTTAALTVVAPETWEISVRGTKVNGSNVPFVDQFLDDNAVEIPVGEVYKTLNGNIPTVILKTFYVDEGMRITRDIDENFFVFTRA